MSQTLYMVFTTDKDQQGGIVEVVLPDEGFTLQGTFESHREALEHLTWRMNARRFRIKTQLQMVAEKPKKQKSKRWWRRKG